MFIGYDKEKKGWRCIFPTTKCAYVSRHLVFDKQSSCWDSSHVFAYGDDTNVMTDSNETPSPLPPMQIKQPNTTNMGLQVSPCFSPRND
jgi:hypothetical protein